MIDVPGGSFAMGSEENPAEKPIHKVTVAPFALSKFPVTNAEWRQCFDAAVCGLAPAGADDEPVRNVS